MTIWTIKFNFTLWIGDIVGIIGKLEIILDVSIYKKLKPPVY